MHTFQKVLCHLNCLPFEEENLHAIRVPPTTQKDFDQIFMHYNKRCPCKPSDFTGF